MTRRQSKTRTEFMGESARREAIDLLLDQRLFVLDADRYDAFKGALDNPPAPGPKLRSLLRRRQERVLELFGKFQWDAAHDYKAERQRR